MSDTSAKPQPQIGSPPIASKEAVVAYRWDRGDLQQLAPAAKWTIKTKSILWIDVAGLNGMLFVEQFGDRVPNLPASAFHLADIGTPPDDPDTAKALGNLYDETLAARMAQGDGIQRFNTGEPVFVVIGTGVKREWSAVICRMTMLAAPGVLVTLRHHPLDLRWSGSHGLPIPERETLALAVTSGAMPKRSSSIALGTLLLRSIADRHFVVARDVRQEIRNRALDYHRHVTQKEPDALGDPEQVTRELYDLRWSLDQFETWSEGSRPDVSRESRVWFDNLDAPRLGADVIRRLETSAVLWRDARHQMADVLGWMSSSQTARLIEVGQAAQQRSEGLQRTISILGALLVGPSIVAAAFDAQSTWLENNDVARSLAMVGGMVLAAAVVWLMIRRSLPSDSGRRSDAQKRVEGVPVYSWPHRLFGMSITRRIPEDTTAKEREG